MDNIKRKIKKQILEQVQTGQTVTYNGKQYIVSQVYNAPVNDPNLQKTLPSDPTKYPVYILQSVTDQDNKIIVTKTGQVQFGG